MLVLESLSLILLTVLCYLCTKSDLQVGLIYNKVLGIFLALALIVDACYYGFFVHDLFGAFMLNVVVVTVSSLYLFYSHSFAGGDCKMMIVVALLFPARLYWTFGSTNITLVFTLVFAIFAGYCYLLGNSIWAIATKKVKITYTYIKDYLLNFLKSYVAAMVYISLLNRLIMLSYNFGIDINMWIIRALCLLVAWGIGRYPVFKKWYVFVPAVCAVIGISIAKHSLPFSVHLENYTLMLVLLVCQMTIKTTIYENIEVWNLKKGMILTTFSSMMMQASITKGLPGISTEDLRSRLTETEIESIKIWAKATHTQSLAIVKKIPFAIFISIGVLIYCAMWGLLL